MPLRCLLAWMCLLSPAVSCAEERPFAIRIVDEATGRGVPLVELKTVNHQLFITDSNGLAAIDEPDLVGQKVYFHIKSHGSAVPIHSCHDRRTGVLNKPELVPRRFCSRGPAAMPRLAVTIRTDR